MQRADEREGRSWAEKEMKREEMKIGRTVAKQRSGEGPNLDDPAAKPAVDLRHLCGRPVAAAEEL